jgi:hypothetical protein
MACKRHAIADVREAGAVENRISPRPGFHLPALCGARARRRIKLSETPRIVCGFL